MPIATITSALRRLLEAMSLRCAASPCASRAGRLVSTSVSTVSPTRISAPTVAVAPISGWKAKQIAR